MWVGAKPQSRPQNIHLVARWLSTLDKKLERYSAGSHEDYRVFISAEPAPTPEAHIIPQGILENAIKITNEPPTGMHANLHKALDLFTQVGRLPACLCAQGLSPSEQPRGPRANGWLGLQCPGSDSELGGRSPLVLSHPHRLQCTHTCPHAHTHAQTRMHTHCTANTSLKDSAKSRGSAHRSQLLEQKCTRLTGFWACKVGPGKQGPGLGFVRAPEAGAQFPRMVLQWSVGLAGPQGPAGPYPSSSWPRWALCSVQVSLHPQAGPHLPQGDADRGPLVLQDGVQGPQPA